MICKCISKFREISVRLAKITPRFYYCAWAMLLFATRLGVFKVNNLCSTVWRFIRFVTLWLLFVDLVNVSADLCIDCIWKVASDHIYQARFLLNFNLFADNDHWSYRHLIFDKSLKNLHVSPCRVKINIISIELIITRNIYLFNFQVTLTFWKKLRSTLRFFFIDFDLYTQHRFQFVENQ